MSIKSIHIFSIDLPVNRPFQWRVLLVLVLLYFLGNLAGVPLLLKTNAPIEPVWFWEVVTLISAMVIDLSMAFLVASLLFGWAHNDARLGNPTPTFGDYALVMALNSTFGFFFGWIFRKLGLEWAMIAHFGFDAFVSLILIPVYLLESPAVWGIFIIGLIIALAVSWRMLLFKPGVRFDMPNTSST
jgi:hypothetical protein